MAFINTVPRDQAEGIVQDGYEMFMQRVGAIPKPLEMLSVSPQLFELQLKRIQYLSQHPKLSFSLLAHIRYLVAHHLAYPFCTDFNKNILQKQGVEEADFQRMEQDPAQALLEEHEITMLVFVIKSVKDPASVTKDDIENLRDFGWEDRDMVDALAQGVGMIDHSIMMQVFRIDQECMVG